MLAAGGLVPHPPVLVPEIGRDRLPDVAATVKAMATLAACLREAAPDVLILSGPHHSEARPGRIGVVAAPELRGDFADFGCSSVGHRVKGAPELAKAVIGANLSLPVHEISSRELDWGYLVFLDAAARAGFRPVVLPLSIAFAPLKACYESGVGLARLVNSAFPGLRISWVASGDLSHCTREGTGREFDPWGKKFDEMVVNAVRDWTPDAILSISGPEIDRARQCGVPSFVAAMGFYEEAGPECKVLSYEDPFGVGYLVAKIEVKGGSPG